MRAGSLSWGSLIQNIFCVVIGAFVDLIGVCCVSLTVEINLEHIQTSKKV